MISRGGSLAQLESIRVALRREPPAPRELDGEHCSSRSVIDAQKTWEIPMKTVVLISYWAGHVPHFEAMWSSTWAEVAPKRVQLGAKLRHVGAKLGHIGLNRCIWPMLVCEICKLPQPGNRLLAPCPGQTWPPSEAVPV